MADSGADGGGDAYDPMKDPECRPRRSNDPGWNYGYWLTPGNSNNVVCNLCGKITKGGIKRHKEHLAGTGGDATGCPKATTQLRREMLEYLEKNRRNIGQPDDDDDVVEVDVAGTVQSSTNEATAQCFATRPSSGTAAKKNKKAFAVKISGKKCQSVALKSIVSMLRKKPEDVVDERRSGCSQSTMESSTKTPEERHYVSMQWALFFYECGIPFNVASCRQFQIAIEASCQYGPGYKPPSPHELREPLLRDCVKETKKLRVKHEVAWKQYGCTLMSDGWSDKRGRHLINFLVNSPAGTYFLESVDASSECQDARMIADLLEKRIEDVGKEYVVQVVTDNGANYKAAGKILMERIPTLYWSPCACHCLDLMLEDIGKLKPFKRPIARGRRVTTFIYRHGRILSLMRKATGGLDLVRPAATRFATSILALKSLVKHKQALRSLFTCQAWVGNKLAKTAAGLNVQDIVLSADWWHAIEDCLRASGPLLRVLRVADGDEIPAMPEMTALMRFAKEKINQGFPHQNKQALLKKIIDIVDKRWENQMDHPLYGAALFLNPGKYFSIAESGDDALIGELRSCFNDVLARTVLDVNTRNKIDAQAVLYEDKRGPFANPMAIDNMVQKNPLDWWRSYGGRAVELQRFAKRTVSLCASSSGCERNWSAFEHIHTKKRNRLQHRLLNDNVFVSYNRKNLDRFQKRREKMGGNSYDPLVIEDFDWGNEWVDPTIPPPQGARGCPDDISWELVDEAVGASSSLQGRNFPRASTMARGASNVNVQYQRQRKRAAPSPTFLHEDDEEDDQEQQPSIPNGEDDDSDFLQDDVDVTDDDEDPTSADQDGKDNTNTTIDEFDDGY
ncbi:uncharacterized protein LOC119267293 [Triticum dicoccoides]|uniref:uncharacterized protein LOC119267293 n=1 Tax=Triticum dicoccoides TaxID=85692 RepID=UPI00188EDEBA|nr:uncharacterized protein LOC119267293 [Triticum dicoccoides]